MECTDRRDLEFILCAAIKRKQPRQVEVNPYYENDILTVELGYRHHDIFIRFGDEISRNPSDQGFFTSKGRFVNRKEAAIIAKTAGQVSSNFSQSRLFSEDLW